MYVTLIVGTLARLLRRVCTGLFVVAMLVSCADPARTTRQPDTTPSELIDPRAVGAEIDERLDAQFDSSATGAFDNVRAFIVTVGGRPVLERYFSSSAEDSHSSFSVTKSVMSVLIGIAIDDGHIDNIDQTLAGLLPAHAADMAAASRTVTLRQLLTMTGGFPPESADALPDAWYKDDDPARRVLSDGPVQTSEASFSYSNAGTHLLSVILSEATGRSTLEYAREKLFAPLGIDTEPAAEPVVTSDAIPGYDAITEYDDAAFAWPRNAKGEHWGDCCIKMPARDMAKLGQLMLDAGRWHGRQVVSADWVRASTRPQVDAGGLTEQYGYLWWVTEADGHAAFAAIGRFGQLIEVVPDLDMVVVVSSSAAPGNAGAALIWTVSHVVAPVLRNQ